MSKRILVCGGRDYADSKTVFTVLNVLLEVHDSLTIIQGGANGADCLARQWCAQPKHRGRVTLITEAADWATHGNAAGPIRNRLMLTEHKPEAVLAFPGGRGTADMVRRARAAGIEVVEVKA